MNQARSVVARFSATPPFVEDPKLKINIDIFKKKVRRLDFFRAKLIFRNINRFTAIDARPCLFLPRGVRVINSDAGVVKQGRICWEKGNLKAQGGRKFSLRFRALQTGNKKFRAKGIAINAPAVFDRDRLRVVSRPKPHPPTG